MTSARVQLRQAQSAVILALVGALLLLSVATGEARAATVAPLPSGDDDAPGIDGLTFVGEMGPVCTGVFGIGKMVIDLGVDEEIDGESNMEFWVRANAAADALEETSGVVVEDGQALGGSLLLFAVLACDEFDDLVDFSTGTAALEHGLEMTSDLLTCRGDLHDLHFVLWALDEASLEESETLLRAEGRNWVSFSGIDYTSPAEGEERDAFEAAVVLALTAASDEIVDCSQWDSVSVPASRLALTCEPTVVTVGQRVTCEVTGGDPDVTILWRASASPAFAGQGVTLGADGRGSFAFVVPASARGSQITVELVDWDRSALVQVAGTAIVPSSVPAGEGSGPLSMLLLVGVALLSTVALRTRIGRGAVGHEG